MVDDPAEAASIVKSEFGQSFGDVDVAASLIQRVAGGEKTQAVALELACQAALDEMRQLALKEGVEAPRVERQLKLMTCAASDDEVAKRRVAAERLGRIQVYDAAVFARTQDGPVNVSMHHGDGSSGRMHLGAWQRDDGSGVDVDLDNQPPNLRGIDPFERGDARLVGNTGQRYALLQVAKAGTRRNAHASRNDAVDDGFQSSPDMWADMTSNYAVNSTTVTDNGVREPCDADHRRCAREFFTAFGGSGAFEALHTLKVKGKYQAREVKKHIIDTAAFAIDVGDVIHRFHRVIARLAGDDVPDAEGKSFFLVFSDSGDLLVELWYHTCAMGARALQQRYLEAETDAILYGNRTFVVGIGASPLMWSFGGGTCNAYYEALRVALAPLRLEPTFVTGVNGVPVLLAAAVFARLAAVSALPEGASEEQQRDALDAVADALKDVVCLDERRFVDGDADDEPLSVAQQLRLDREFEERVEARVEQARAARAVKMSAQREAIGKALESMKLQLHVVTGVARVPHLVGAAVIARRDALSALGGAASPEQQLERLDAVAAVFETKGVWGEGVSLAPLRFCGDQPLPLAKQLAINAELVQRIQEAQVQRIQEARAPAGVQTTRSPRTRLTLRALRRRPRRTGSAPGVQI